MKKYKIGLIIGAICLVVVFFYLVALNSASTDKDEETFYEKKKERCWTLEDGRTVCHLGVINISSGEVLEEDFKVKDKKKNK